MTSESSKNLLPIPQVPKHLYGLLGNLPDVDPSFFMRSVWHLAGLYGDIFELDLLNRKAIVVSSYALAKEVFDDDRFEKIISGGLIELRPLIKDGLFSAFPDEINWHKAHRILMPVFGPLAVRKMFDGQVDIASQLILKWDRMGPNHAISCSDDFTRLAFDTIGLCAYSYRFNNFYADKMHPFATQMADALIESGKRATRTKLETSLRYFSYKEFQQNVTDMHKLCDEIVDERVKNPQPDNKDLLGVMLNVADPDTEEKLDTETVRYNMVTFLIAGHETTSGTLSFLFYYLLKNPETYHKAQSEVDEVVGNDALTVNHLSQLKYIDACIKETLRFQGPIGAVTRHAKHEGEVIGGKYAVDTKTGIVCNLRGIHRDPAVWGDDAGEFKPERMLDFKNIPAGAWKPFGTGIRACIGRAFAEQEMLINVALILQRFQVEMADPSYTLDLKSTLTMKPADFNIKVRRRPNRSAMVGLQSSGQDTSKVSNGAHKEDSKEKDSNQKEIVILYGSNAGTCRAYADDLAENAGQFGFSAKVKVLDTAIEDIPTKSPVVIITPSYEGKPADNAKKFVSWLEVNASQQHKFQGVQYALFGVGNSEWASTFHKVPKRVDELMSSMGATTIHQTGFVDVKTDTVGPWEKWCEEFWPKVTGNAASVVPTVGLKVKIEKAEQASSSGESEPSLGIVKENIELADNTVGPAKMHMEIKLPENTTYRTGDYMVIHPYNHRDDVRRVLSRFKLRAGDTMEISDTNKAFLITRGPVTVYVLLASKVELSTPVTQRQLEKLSSLSTNSAEEAAIKAIASNKTFPTEVLAKRFSILDILEDFPSCNLSFAEYLDLLKPLTPRQYSISSFPATSNNMETNSITASITYDVHECPAWSGNKRFFHGVASSYLADCKPGNQILCSVRPTNAAFHLPPKTETPIILIAAGTGIAPMRGFIQERAAILGAGGKTLGPALFYFGCRDFEEDYIYKKELEHWEALGAISIRPCFSKRAPPNDDPHYHYTSDRLYAERDEVAELFAKGAKIFVCGSASKIARSTAETCIKIWLERHPDKSQKDAEEWLDQQRETRYVSDVFG